MEITDQGILNLHSPTIIREASPMRKLWEEFVDVYDDALLAVILGIVFSATVGHFTSPMLGLSIGIVVSFALSLGEAYFIGFVKGHIMGLSMAIGCAMAVPLHFMVRFFGWYPIGFFLTIFLLVILRLKRGRKNY